MSRERPIVQGRLASMKESSRKCLDAGISGGLTAL
jgi:hypothetical protein